MKSIFTDKHIVPDESQLIAALGITYPIWLYITKYVLAKGHVLSQEWKYSGDKFGWGFRISDKKRVLVYLLPRDGFFRVGFVFGQKAFEAILENPISDEIKNELREAKAYTEGKGIRIEVRNESVINDIKKLIAIKIEY